MDYEEIYEKGVKLGKSFGFFDGWNAALDVVSALVVEEKMPIEAMKELVDRMQPIKEQYRKGLEE